MTRIVSCFALLAAFVGLAGFLNTTPALAGKFRQSYCLHMAGANVDPNPVCYRSNRMCLNMRDRQTEFWSKSGTIVTGTCSLSLR